MRHTHGEEALFVVALAALVACADPATRIAGPTTSTAGLETGTGAGVADERSALSTIARLVAVSLDNEPARQHLKRDMRAARFREHKLALGPYLHSKDGKALLKRMTELSGTSEEVLFGTLNAVRPLEFYMPVAGHREKWTGKEDVLVVSQLDEWQPIVAFDEAGREVKLDRAAPPTQPTLSIVPVETRFDAPMDSLKSKNARDANGAAIGTLEPIATVNLANRAASVVCDASCSGGETAIEVAVGDETATGGGVASIPPGLYLEFSRILDAKEPWFRGDPEIEVHIQGPQQPGSPTSGIDLSCSGEHAYDYAKVFDQNDGFWQGRVLLYSEAEALAFANKFNQGFHVIFWEDDNEPCLLKVDNNSLVAAVQSTARALGAVALKVFPTTRWWVIGGAFIATLFSDSGPWLLTNDDFLGVATPQPNAEYNYPDNTHVIMDGTRLNGRATIVWR
ncbi:MAG: hypothetical protein ABR585_08345 [Gemmatimonadaceae bacterium]